MIGIQFRTMNPLWIHPPSMLWMQRRHPTLFLSSGRRVLGSAHQPGLPRLSRSSLNAATRTYCYMHLKMCTCTWGYNHVISHVNPRFGWLSLPRQVLWCLAISAKESPEKYMMGIAQGVHHSSPWSTPRDIPAPMKKPWVKPVVKHHQKLMWKLWTSLNFGSKDPLQVAKRWVRTATSPSDQAVHGIQPSWSSTRTKKRSSCLGSRVADAASCAADAAICAASWSTSSQLKQYPHIGYPRTGKFKCLQSKGDTLP